MASRVLIAQFMHETNTFSKLPTTLDDYRRQRLVVGRWRFDTDAGADEVVNRRVGANERNAIFVLRASVDAQRDYAARDRNGDGVLEYAGRIAAERAHGIAHCGEIDHGGDAGEVLHQHAGGAEGDLALALARL